MGSGQDEKHPSPHSLQRETILLKNIITLKEEKCIGAAIGTSEDRIPQNDRIRLSARGSVSGGSAL